MKRFPLAFGHAGDTLRVSPKPSSSDEKTVIQTEFCTLSLHNSYTAKSDPFISHEIKSL